VLRPPARPLAETWVTMRLKSGNAVDSFWPGSGIRAREQAPCSRAKDIHYRALVMIEPVPHQPPGQVMLSMPIDRPIERAAQRVKEAE
jgi:hypothetical protein